MRVAVVGATGLLGQRLCRRLVERGDSVRALVRRDGPLADVETVLWDGAGPVPLGVLETCDAVVNLAGAPVAQRWNDEVKRTIRDSRVGSTKRLVEAIGAGGPRVLVNASAVGFYGDRDEPVGEAATMGRGFLAEVCREWEGAARLAERDGVRVVMLRTGIVLAREGGALPKMLAPARLGLAGRLGSGRQWFPWVHVDDAIGLILHALDTPTLSGPLNVVAPGVLRQAEFAKALGAALGRPSFMPTPAIALRVLFGEGAAVLLEGQHAVPAAAIGSGYTFRFSDVTSAVRDLLTTGPADSS